MPASDATNAPDTLASSEQNSGNAPLEQPGQAPTEPVTPTEPETPTDPVTPTGPETPTDPVTPSEPEVPAEPETPAEPVVPVNDDIAQAQALTLGVSITGSTTGADAEAGEVGWFGARTVWYRYEPAADGVVTLKTGANTTLIVQWAEATIPAGEITHADLRNVTNNQVSGDFLPAVSFRAEEGRVYYIQAALMDEAEGSFPLEIVADPEADLTPPPLSGIASRQSGSQASLSGLSEEGARIRVLDAEGQTIATATAGADGSWTAPLAAGLATGEHALSVIALDALGNQVTEPFTLTVAPVEGAHPGGQPVSYITVDDSKTEWNGTNLNDHFLGHDAKTVLAGGLGDDTYSVGAGDTVVEKAGEGVDTVRTWLQDYVLPENVENLVLEGDGWLRATGNDLDNMIAGNARSNVIDGGKGDDVLTGGGSDYQAGHLAPIGDTFVIRKGDGNDVITDFRPGANLNAEGPNGGDVIRLVGFGDSFRQLSDVLERAVVIDGKIRINLGDGQTLVLRSGLQDADGRTIPLSLADLDHHDFDYGAAITAARLVTEGGATSVLLSGTGEIYPGAVNTAARKDLVFVAIRDLGIPDPEMEGANIIGYAEVKADGSWTYEVTGVTGDGPHRYAVSSTQSKWNVAGESTNVPAEDIWHHVALSTSEAVIATAESPAVPLIGFAEGQDSGASATDGITSHADLSLTGTAAEGSTVSLYLDGTLLAQGIAVTDGRWSYTASALAEGEHRFTAEAVGSHGQVSTRSVAAVMTVDTVAPEMTLRLDPSSDAPSPGNGATRDTTPMLSGTAEAGSSITLHLHGEALGTVAADAEGHWSFTLQQALEAGSHTVTALATDLAGNVSEAAVLDFTVTAPRDMADFAATLPLFDSAFYLSTYQDVAQAGVDAFTHFMQFGLQEQRDPNAFFHTTYYLNQNTDVAAAGINPLLHYLQSGGGEGRAASLDFDSKAYLALNGDVAEAGMNPLLHYLLYGQGEDRAIAAATPHATSAANPLVDAAFYYAANEDVARTGMDAGQHYAASGWQEGRDPNAFFDVSYYLERYDDVKQADMDPLLHYMEFGWEEGRDPSAAFSTTKYLQAHADVAEAGMDPLLHYLQFGRYDGHDAFPAG